MKLCGVGGGVRRSGSCVECEEWQVYEYTSWARELGVVIGSDGRWDCCSERVVGHCGSWMRCGEWGVYECTTWARGSGGISESDGG